jgi:hypothetical protein
LRRRSLSGAVGAGLDPAGVLRTSLTLEPGGRVEIVFLLGQAADRRHLDELLANGWRHFAESFYRYDRTLFDGSIREVMPLRIKLSDFVPSKSQRRILKRNCDLEIALNPAEIDEESVALFRSHRERFKSNAPNSLYDYLSIFGPAERPSPVGEMRVRREKKLVAVSYFDLGRNALSGIYAMFDPSEACNSPELYPQFKRFLHIVSAHEHGALTYPRFEGIAQNLNLQLASTGRRIKVVISLERLLTRFRLVQPLFVVAFGQSRSDAA